MIENMELIEKKRIWNDGFPPEPGWYCVSWRNNVLRYYWGDEKWGAPVYDDYDAAEAAKFAKHKARIFGIVWSQVQFPRALSQ